MTNKEPGQDIWNAFWSKKQDLTKVYPSSAAVLKTIKSRFHVKDLKILEVGAGTGRDSCELARLGADVTVLDFADRSLEIVGALADQLELKNVRLIRGDAFSSPIADQSFDLVFHQGLAEHFHNPVDLLKENWRLLKVGGHCLCDVPQTIHMYTVVKKILIAMDKWFAGWETQFTMGELRSLMKEAGFEIDFCYGDWMRPNFVYRVLRELSFKLGFELPKYPLQKTAWHRIKEHILDSISTKEWAFYTQLSIGVVGVRR